MTAFDDTIVIMQYFLEGMEANLRIIVLIVHELKYEPGGFVILRCLIQVSSYLTSESRNITPTGADQLPPNCRFIFCKRSNKPVKLESLLRTSLGRPDKRPNQRNQWKVIWEHQ